jgi:hypothetical protein
MTNSQSSTAYLRRATLPIGSNLPVADAITVARVSAPRSADRALLTANLHALTNWFRSCSRVVKQNDIIHVCIGGK